MNKQPTILLFVILALLATAPFSNAQAQQPSEEQLAKILKRFPEADTDKDGKLTTEEIQQFRQSRQRNTRPAAAAQPTQAGDAKLTETLAGMNARFKNVELELLEWPSLDSHTSNSPKDLWHQLGARASRILGTL